MFISSNKTSFHEKYRIIGEHVTDYNFSPHMHDQCEYIYVKKGTCFLYVNSELVTLNSGEAFFLIPWQLHSIESEKNSELYIVTFSNEAIAFFDEYIDIDNCSSNPYIPSKNVNEIVFSELVGKKCSSIITLCACANLICNDFLKNNPQPKANKKSGTDNTISINATKFMRLHYKEKITLPQVAKAVGTSASYLSRVLSNTNSLGFAGYLDELRISYAQMLLRTTDMKIAEIAKASGYSNIRTFNRKFKEHFFQSPTELRKDEKQESKNNSYEKKNGDS